MADHNLKDVILAIIPIADYNITRFLLLILYEVKNDGIFNNNRNVKVMESFF